MPRLLRCASFLPGPASSQVGIAIGLTRAGYLGALAALMGVNACVVGILLAALYQPIWTSAVATAADFAVVIVAMTALMAWRVPPWAVVVLCGVVGALW